LISGVIVAEKHSYLTRFPQETWEKVQQKASDENVSVNTLINNAVEGYLGFGQDAQQAVSFYSNSRSLVGNVLRSFADATGDDSYDMAFQALAGTPEEKQDGISEESGD
jgi:hypothetical protein